MYEEQEDDRFDRWCDANGIHSIGWETLNDGKQVMRYWRKDGSLVEPTTSYPYDAQLTPYTREQGRA